MWTRHHKQRRTGALILPVLATAFLAYFGFHAYHGDYGIYAKYRLEDRIVHLERDLSELKARRVELERKVALLHDGTLEKDMLDEQVRRTLNLVHPADVVIMRTRRSN